MTNTIEGTNITLSPINMEARKKLDIRPGNTVRVHQKIVEKGKTRTQVFEGLVLAVKHGKEPGGTFTVRKVSSGVGVERVFPIHSPNIEKIEIMRQSKVRQSKLYYIREKVARQIRSKIKQMMVETPQSTEMFEKEDEEKAKAEEERAAAEAQEAAVQEGAEALESNEVEESKDPETPPTGGEAAEEKEAEQEEPVAEAEPREEPKEKEAKETEANEEEKKD